MAPEKPHALSLCRADTSELVVVDVQPRLGAAMPEQVRQRTYHNIELLLEAARVLGVTLAATEQYPQGLGATEPNIAGRFPEQSKLFVKTSFSCCGASGFVVSLDIDRRPQLVLAGLEAHVCILQTALELAHRGFRVFVVEDATCSRNPEHHANSMERMRQAGIVITNTESVIFEWLQDARNEHFKTISALLK